MEKESLTKVFLPWAIIDKLIISKLHSLIEKSIANKIDTHTIIFKN
jgi:hypothetical protein